MAETDHSMPAAAFLTDEDRRLLEQGAAAFDEALRSDLGRDQAQRLEAINAAMRSVFLAGKLAESARLSDELREAELKAAWAQAEKAEARAEKAEAWAEKAGSRAEKAEARAERAEARAASLEARYDAISRAWAAEARRPNEPNDG